MNSVSESLYHEVPLLMLPQTPEQGAVAARTRELGAGELLLKGDKAEIISAVDKVLNHSEYKEAAVKISKSFKESGGVVRAREYLESVR